MLKLDLTYNPAWHGQSRNNPQLKPNLSFSLAKEAGDTFKPRKLLKNRASPPVTLLPSTCAPREVPDKVRNPHLLLDQKDDTPIGASWDGESG